MTLYEIKILIHYASCVGDDPQIQRPPPIWADTIKGLLAEGLLMEPPVQTVGNMYQATEKCRAFVEALQRLPLPVPAWKFTFPADAVWIGK